MQFLIFGIGLLLLPKAYSATIRVYYSKCGANGFTCVTNQVTKKVDITYQCPNGVNDVTIYTNQFSAPGNIEVFRILNCQSLTIYTRCSNENKPYKILQIANIKHLSIQRAQYDPLLPPTVIFENISLINEIPAKTFGQIDKPNYSYGCYVQPIDFQNILFKNVAIGTIKSEAFLAQNNFQDFTFLNVSIGTIQTSGINIKHGLTGNFEIRHSNIKEIEHLGVRVYGKKVVFALNEIKKVASSGINATTEHFYFTGNSVESLQPQAFSVLATNIFILDNKFQAIKSGAFEKLSPGLLQDSGRNFGTLKFIYDFSKNTLGYLEIGSLHPDYLSYENVRTEMMFTNNKITCSCENLGWLFLPTVLDRFAAEPFYEMVLDDNYDNKCDNVFNSDCELYVSVINKLIKCGKCLSNITLEDFCEKPTTELYTIQGTYFNTLSNKSIIPSNYSISISCSPGNFIMSVSILLVFLNLVLLLEY